MKPTCLKCVHYFITWDKDRPHGCRAMGFKSRRRPIEVVRMNTPGMDCQAFKKKRKKACRP